jgi:hypothetical protein
MYSHETPWLSYHLWVFHTVAQSPAQSDFGNLSPA